MNNTVLIVTETYANEIVEPYWRFYAYADILKTCGFTPINIFGNNSELLNCHGYKNGKIEQIESIIKKQKIDLVIAYTFGKCLPWLKYLYSKKIPIINRIDSDGRVSMRHYPFSTFRFFTFPQPNFILKAKAAKFWLQRYLFQSKSQMHEIVQNAELSDYLAFGSPGGVENYSSVLRKIGRHDLASKCIYIPNPTNNAFFNEPLKEKQNIVFSIVNWKAQQTALWKNAKLLIEVYKKASKAHPNWKFMLIGDGAHEKFKKTFAGFSNVVIEDKINNHQLPTFISTAKILAITSLREGAPIVVNEALGMGCSVVSTPLPGVNIQMDKEHCGTFSKNFGLNSFVKAIETEISNWESGLRNPIHSSLFWRQKLSHQAIGKIIENHFYKLTRNRA